MAKTERDMQGRPLDDARLGAFFAAARAESPVPSEALMTRIMADAEAEMAARAGAARPGLRRPGLWAALVAAIGGWPALAGMVTAAVTGVWLGFAAPDSLNTLSGGVLLPDAAVGASYDIDDLVPGYTGFAELYEEG